MNIASVEAGASVEFAVTLYVAFIYDAAGQIVMTVPFTDREKCQAFVRCGPAGTKSCMREISGKIAGNLTG